MMILTVVPMLLLYPTVTLEEAKGKWKAIRVPYSMTFSDPLFHWRLQAVSADLQAAAAA